MHDPYLPNFPQRFILCCGDIDGLTKWERAEIVGEGVDREFEYGIEGTDRCLRTEIQWTGRHGDISVFGFYPSKDFVLYNIVSPIVHGSRAIFLWALDNTLHSGNGGLQAPLNSFRYPDLMLDWGPSLDEDNVDVFGRGLCALDSLTGQVGGGPDFLSILVSDDWSILDTDSAQNTVNDYLNFIALRDSETEDMVLMVVNDSLYTPISDECIVFPGTREADYDIHHVAGFECTEERADPPLGLNFDGMEPFTASLYWFEYKW